MAGAAGFAGFGGPGLFLIVRRSLRQHALSTAITVCSVALASGLVMAVFAIGAQTKLAFTGAPAVLPHIRSGRLRALAVSSAQRLPALREVPTVAESGYPGFEADQWYGIVAPAGTPVAMVMRLNAEINKALALPDVAQQLAVEGAVPMPTTPQAFGQLIEREIPRWAEVVKAGHVRPD